MKLMIDLFSTDYGLMSIIGIGMMIAANALLIGVFVAGDDFGGALTALGFIGVLLAVVEQARQKRAKGRLARNDAQREEILCFCQAGPNDGGGGALLVLLRAQNAAQR